MLHTLQEILKLCCNMESIGQISPAEEETHLSSTEVSYADGISKY